MYFLIPLSEKLARRVVNRKGLQSRTLETPGGTLHIYDGKGQGTAPTVVVLHGLSASSSSLGPLLIELLKSAKRVIAIDLPGHGFSTKSDLVLTPQALFDSVDSAITQLNIGEPFTLVGNSLGGAISLGYAIRKPENIAQLVLVSPAGARSTRDEWKELIANFNIQTRSDGALFLNRLYHRKQWFVPLLAHELRSSFGRPAVQEIFANGRNEDLPSPEEISALKVPVLFIWGMSERLLPATYFDYFTRHLPKHAKVERPEGYGHCPHLDNPKDLGRRIREFVAASVSS